MTQMNLPVVLYVRTTCLLLRTSALIVQSVGPVKLRVVPNLLSNGGNRTRQGQHPVKPLPDYVDIGIIYGRQRLSVLFVTVVSSLMNSPLQV